MGQTVYADLLFLINFSMDFLCFFLCARLLSRRLFVGRTVLAAALGGVYAVCSLLWKVSALMALLADVAVCAVMCAISFGGRDRWRSVPLTFPVYLAVSMVLGGFMTALFHLLNRVVSLPEQDAAGDEGMTVWLFALLAALSALFTLLGGRFFRKRTEQRTARICVTYEGKTIMLSAITDSGNLLREPISGKPCIVVDVGALKTILPVSLLRAARQKDMRAVEQMPTSTAKNIRLLPVRTAAGDGMLIALRVQQITVDSGKGARAVDALIALSELGDGADGNQALLPSELLV